MLKEGTHQEFASWLAQLSSIYIIRNIYFIKIIKQFIHAKKNKIYKISVAT